MAFEFDIGDMLALDNFADSLSSFDFLKEVDDASKKIEGTLRSNQSRARDQMSTLRRFMAEDFDEAKPEFLETGSSDFDPKRIIDSNKPLFEIGAKVFSMYYDDGLFYESTIKSELKDGNGFLVVFSGYENEQETENEHIRPVEAVEDFVANQAAEATKMSANSAERSAETSDVLPEELAAELEDLQRCFDESEALVDAKTHQMEQLADSKPSPKEEKAEMPFKKSPETPLKGTGKDVRATIRARAADRRAEQAARVEERQKAEEELRKQAQDLEQSKEAQLLELNQMLDSQPSESPKESTENSVILSSEPNVADDSLSKAQNERERVVEIEKGLKLELKETAQRRVVRQQMRQEVIQNTLTAILDQRVAIRLEARQTILLAKRTATCAGRLQESFIQCVREVTLAGKLSLSMVAIMIQQTQFKTLSAKLQVHAQSFQRELVKLIKTMKKEHVRLTEESNQNGANVALLSSFAESVSSVLATTNEIVAAHEHSSATIKAQKDGADGQDAARAELVMDKLAKCERAKLLLDERIEKLEKQVTITAAAKSSRQNPSRGK